MAANNFNTDIPPAVIANILNLLGQAETALAPFVVPLSEEQKKHLPKIADKTIPFAEKADAYLDSEPKYNPPFISVPETHKDFKNFQKVQPMLKKINGLKKEINDIAIVAGSDAIIQFLAYYNSVQQAAKQGVPGAKTIYDELSARFPGRGKTPTQPPPAKPI